MSSMNRFLKQLTGAAAAMLAALTLATLSVLPAEAAAIKQAGPGKVTLLRVHDLGTGWGPASDFIDVEVVIRLDSAPGMAFGFQLRDDGYRPAHQAMLDMLRDAFQNNSPVTINYYEVSPSRTNHVMFRAWATK
jgi:hypothetical protein